MAFVYSTLFIICAILVCQCSGNRNYDRSWDYYEYLVPGLYDVPTARPACTKHTAADGTPCRCDSPCEWGPLNLFCYIDDNDNWKYCCTGGSKCQYQFVSTESGYFCYSGSQYVSCEKPEPNPKCKPDLTRTGEPCLCYSEGCHSTHLDLSFYNLPLPTYYWCYTSDNGDWEYCCEEECEVQIDALVPIPGISTHQTWNCWTGIDYVQCNPNLNTLNTNGTIKNPANVHNVLHGDEYGEN